MNDQARLLDGSFSEGLETVMSLVRCSEFTGYLGKSIRQQGGAERAVLALRREFLPQPQIVTGNGNGGAYRESGGVVLPPDHFIVPCRYAKLPPMDQLKKTFPGGVSGIFDGRDWEKYSLCVNASEEPGDRIVLAKSFGQEIRSEAAIAWGNDYRTEFAPNGYRPMMGRHEIIDFHLAHPGECKKSCAVALGSFTLDDDNARIVAVLDAYSDRPWLHDGWFDGRWDAGHRFLFVRK